MRSLKSFLKNNSGNVAMMFGVCSFALIGIVGAAVDYSGMTRAKQELQAQTDSAALAAAAYLPDDGESEGNTKTARETIAREMIIGNGISTTTANATLSYPDKATLQIDADTQYKTMFMGMIGKSIVTINSSATVNLPNQDKMNLEMVLVLDNTDSMNEDGKLDTLKVAANNLVTALEDTGSEKIKVGLVPFARYVNVGTDKEGESWLAVPADSSATRTQSSYTKYPQTCVNSGTKTIVKDGFTVTVPKKVCTEDKSKPEIVPAKTYDVNSEWRGCVGVRTTPRDMKDGEYTAEKVPGLPNRALKEDTGYSSDIYSYCPRAIVGLTKDFDEVRLRINDLFGIDNTYIPLGLEWGKRVLSKEKPYNEGKKADKTRKVMVLMTDGKNTVQRSPDAPWLNNSTDPTTSPEADADTAALCTDIKADTEVFTIAFKVNDTSTRNMLRNCATTNSQYYQADDNASLITAFEEIADSLGEKVRLKS